MSAGHPPGTDCKCCAGVDVTTPRSIDNRPGLPAIAYRIGRHGDFVESMQARLSSADDPALAGLTTREPSDFTLALVDALASSLDVLTFYIERFANEHYLRTATERRSVLEMSRLIGYELAPGVAASTHLAFTLQSNRNGPQVPIEIPVGTRVQSVPGQGEQAQTFETVTAVPATADWNAIPVQAHTPWQPEAGDTDLWLEGVDTQLQPGDAILIVGADRMEVSGSEHWDVRVLAGVEPDNENLQTRVHWDDQLGSVFPRMGPAHVSVEVHAFRHRAALFGHNAPDPNLMGNKDSNVAKLIDETETKWRWNNFRIATNEIDLDTENRKITVGSWIALVSNDSRFGSGALPGYTELYRAKKVIHPSRTDFGLSGKITRIKPDTQENLEPDRFRLRHTLVLAQSERLATANRPLFRPVYGKELILGRHIEDLRPGQPLALCGKRQRIAVAADDLTLESGGSLLRGEERFLLHPVERLLVDSAGQCLSDRPGSSLDAGAFYESIGKEDVCLRLRLMDRHGSGDTLIAKGNQIALAPNHDDDPWLREIAFISPDSDAVTPAGDFTRINLGAPVQRLYARAELRVNANVAPVTHGEAVKATLGSGNAAEPNQRFALGQWPLAFVGASTPSGRASTLEVRVNDVLWTEVPALYEAPADARLYETTQRDDAVTIVQFGDGDEGARLPSGQGNVRVRYRKGLGAAGNVGAGQLTTLLSRPLGVTEVVNPTPATGGEDAETLQSARANAPLTVLTLDRAVSIEDYANFARAFAGIDKAHALWIAAGPARGVFLTVAGVEGVRLPDKGGTVDDLRKALVAYGDPQVPLRIVQYDDRRFQCGLAVKVKADFETDPVRDAVRLALRDHFSFARRSFGQTVSVDEVAAVAQGVDGVEAAHVTELYRVGSAVTREARLFAALPLASFEAVPAAAELLTLADDPIEPKELL